MYRTFSCPRTARYTSRRLGWNRSDEAARHCTARTTIDPSSPRAGGATTAATSARGMPRSTTLRSSSSNCRSSGARRISSGRAASASTRGAGSMNASPRSCSPLHVCSIGADSGTRVKNVFPMRNRSCRTAVKSSAGWAASGASGSIGRIGFLADADLRTRSLRPSQARVAWLFEMWWSSRNTRSAP